MRNYAHALACMRISTTDGPYATKDRLHKVVVLEDVVIRIEVDLGKHLGRAELGLRGSLGLARVNELGKRARASGEMNVQRRLGESEENNGRTQSGQKRLTARGS